MSKRVAIVDWNHLIEDYLDNIGLTMDDFTGMRGGWLFNYIEALKSIGHEPIFYCFSSTIDKAEKRKHVPSNTVIKILPSPKIYRSIRKRIVNPYAPTIHQATITGSFFSNLINKILYPLAPYLATSSSLLKKAFKEDGIDVIFCQEYENPRFDICSYYGYLSKTPVYGIFQGGNWQLSALEKYIRKRTLNIAKGLIIGSTIEKERVLTKYSNLKVPLHLIYNPIEVIRIERSKQECRTSLNISNESFIALWYGRIDYHRKGLDRLLASWRRIKSKNAKLYIIGQGSGNELLQNQFDQYPSSNIIWIKKYVTDRAELFEYAIAADVFLFFSRNEGFPVAPLEAMAHGLPVIATDDSGMNDVLLPESESGGILLPKTASPEFIAESIDTLFIELTKSKRRSELARERVANSFSLKKLCMELDIILNK